MNCLICNSRCSYFFSKEYSEPPFDNFMQEIGPIEYYKCDNCGFVLSKTHQELDFEKWCTLNNRFHHYLENPQNDIKCNQPPYLEQAMMINLLGKNSIIDLKSTVDFAAGYGTLSKILLKYFSINLPIFDPFIHSENTINNIESSELGLYKTVINSAFFEHILKRDDLERLNDIVHEEGCLIIHSVICETVPKDPSWFYLWPPVHTAFHTNKSMGILMEQWGYSSSIYCPKAKSWVLFKIDNLEIESSINKINRDLQSEWFIFKRGFVDYWKGF